MPGANYFLSKLATQTPGPLVGTTVAKSQPPCLDLVPVSVSNTVNHEVPPIPPYCQDVSCVSTKDPEVYENIYSRPMGRQYVQYGSRGSFYTQLPINMKGLEENPVGELQELCTKMRWVFPSYAVCCENGQPHERTFVIAVRLYNVKDKGEAKSKKAAKREAARNLLFQLLEKSSGQRYSGQVPSAAVEYKPVSDSPKKSVAQQIQLYQETPSHTKCIDMLQELAVRRNLRIVYIRLDSRTATGLIQVMLQISTSPIVVVSGQGRTVLEAKAEAALNALECIRITAKKMPFQAINLNL